MKRERGSWTFTEQGVQPVGPKVGSAHPIVTGGSTIVFAVEPKHFGLNPHS
jgi:hypothetical protein